MAAPFANSEARKTSYRCLNQPINFIAATAEFQPFVSESFEWVHKRSMFDHVQVPNLAILEAWRVLCHGGRTLIGLYVEGGKSGVVSFVRLIKDLIKAVLQLIGITHGKDLHVGILLLQP